jgi:hypothetical protein
MRQLAQITSSTTCTYLTVCDANSTYGNSTNLTSTLLETSPASTVTSTTSYTQSHLRNSLPEASAQRTDELQKMVQFRDFSYGVCKVPRNKYWALDSGESRGTIYLLEVLKLRRHYHHSKKWRRFKALYVRCQRGLISYEGFSARELKLFVKQRALTIEPNKKPTIPALRRLLEQADDDATFDRFLELPPETRL